MNKKKVIMISIISLTLLSTILPTLTAGADDVVMTGPWADELFFKIYLSPEPEFLALKAGDINLMDWELPAQKVEDAVADPTIGTASSPDLGFYQIDINHQKWPTSDLHFRRALAHLVDKARIETDILEGFGYKLESVVPVVMGGWSNPDIMTYEYSPTLAAAELDAGGFTDTDGDDIRNDPLTGENMAEVKFYIRIDDPERKQAGQWLADGLEALGVPVYDPVVERSVCSQEVMNSAAGDWNVYTGGWGIGRDPDHLTDFYHSKEFDPEIIGGWRGYNYVGFVNDTYDTWADLLKTASTFEGVKEAAYKCQEIMAEQVTVIPMYGHIGVKAYSIEWTGLVNEVGQGINSWWSAYNMHPADLEAGGRIEYGIKSDIETLNLMTAQWTYTWEVLDKVYEYIYTNNPYDLSEDWPWLAEDWTIEDYEYANGDDGIKVTFNFVDDAFWHDGTPFTAADVKFTYDYLIEQAIPRYLPSVQFITDVVQVDDYTVEVYQNTTSYFAFHYINIPVLPKHIWEDVGAGWQDYDPVAEGELVGLGPWKFVKYVAGEYVHLVANEAYWKFPDRFYQGLSDSDIQQAQEISALKAQLEAATTASESAQEDIATLSGQLLELQASTVSLLEQNSDDINSLESGVDTISTQIEALKNDIEGYEAEVTTLQSGISNASTMGYVGIGLAIVAVAVAYFLSKKD